MYALYLFLLSIYQTVAWGDTYACAYLHVEDWYQRRSPPRTAALRVLAEVVGGWAAWRSVALLRSATLYAWLANQQAHKVVLIISFCLGRKCLKSLFGGEGHWSRSACGSAVLNSAGTCASCGGWNSHRPTKIAGWTPALLICR